MIFKNCFFILMVTFLSHESLVEAYAPTLRKFGLLDIARNDRLFTKAFTQSLVSTTEHHKYQEQNEEMRQKIYRERLLNRVNSAVLKDFYSRLF